MDDFEYFKATYGLRDEDVVFVPYGSRIYGTNRPDSDYDYMAIVPANRRADTGTEYNRGNTNIHIYNRYDFQQQLNLHKVHALEGYFLPDGVLRKMFQFKLQLPQLREAFSEKASNSWVKAKKKIDKEKDFYIGWKSLFHSLRILIFGAQIAKDGQITDYSAANQIWFDVLNAQQYNWDFFKQKYQPEYNRLATEFRKLAPKE
jgi:predicted nucleotidyltransferase